MINEGPTFFSLHRRIRDIQNDGDVNAFGACLKRDAKLRFQLLRPLREVGTPSTHEVMLRLQLLTALRETYT